MESLQFSIVIPTLNEEKYLPVLLKDLAEQTFKSFEVILVDGGSEDKTIDKCKHFFDKLDITILHSDKKNVGYQRNLGGDTASGTWIVFMDADNRLTPNFLEKLFNQLKDNRQTDVFTCLTTSLSKPQKDMMTYHLINMGQLLSYFIGHYTAYGAMIGIKRSIFHTLKFDTKRKLFEDTLFVQAVAKKGYTFKFFKEPRYEYSLRRFKKEGTLHTFRNTCMVLLNFLLGRTVHPSEKLYPMSLGGKYYEESVSSD